MVVSIDQIRDEGLTVQDRVSVEALTVALTEGRDSGFRPAQPAHVSATFHKVSGGVFLEGKLDAELTSPCSRCVTEVKLKVSVPFSLNLVPKSRLPREAADNDDAGEDAGSFELADANREVFDGKSIDLDPIIREQVLLALPMHALCREDCKGLCDLCGQNLNEKQCSCERERVDPRLMALKNIKLN